VLAGCRSILGIDPLEGVGEVPGDAATSDVASADVATDGAPDADAGPRYCATLTPTPQFCADFDEADFERGWDNDTDAGIPDPGEIAGGMLSADTMRFESKPASLLVQTPYTLSATGDPSAIVVKTVPATSRLTLQFDLFVDADRLTVMGTGVTVAGLDYGKDGGIAVFLDSSGLELAIEGGAPDAGASTVQHITAFPTGMWTTIEIIVSKVPAADQPGGWVSVECGGGCAGGTATAPLPLLIENSLASSFLVLLGSLPGGPVGAFEANIDNVRMYWH
jgi:hypothetical protein